MATDYTTPINSAGAYLTGTPLPLGDLPELIAYDGAFVSTITVQYYGNTYIQTFTNNGTNITNISGWVLQ